MAALRLQHSRHTLSCPTVIMLLFEMTLWCPQQARFTCEKQKGFQQYIALESGPLLCYISFLARNVIGDLVTCLLAFNVNDFLLSQKCDR